MGDLVNSPISQTPEGSEPRALGKHARSLRHRRTAEELKGLADRFAHWVTDFPDVDEQGQPVGRHRTRLDALETVFDQFQGKLSLALEELARQIPNQEVSDGAFYEG